jgi:hypothetical protein
MVRLTQILDVATLTRVPVLVWGPPGVGKSAAIQHWAHSRGLRCWTVIASLREPADFAGLPIVGSEPTGIGDTLGPSITFAPPRFALEANRAGGVIFLDELTTAPPAVQAALLRAVIDRAFGDLELDPEKVTVVAAANPPSEAAGGWDLAAPLANRFSHQEYRLVPEGWVEGFPGYWGKPPALSFGGRALAETAWSQARALVAAFIRVRPGLLLQVPDDVSRRGEAWPSPRTWDFASRLLAGLERPGRTPDDALPLIAGCVGDDPALELATWLRELDLPDPEHLLAEPDAYRHPSRGDQAYAVLGAVCQAAIGRLSPERWLAAWKVLALAARAGGADVAASAAGRLARAQTADLPLPTQELEAFFPILRAASLLGAR